MAFTNPFLVPNVGYVKFLAGSTYLTLQEKQYLKAARVLPKNLVGY